MAKVLLIKNANKEEFYAYVDSLEMNVDGVNNVDVVQSDNYINDYILVLNGEICATIRYDGSLDSITMYIEKHDNQLKTLRNIWNYTVSNYLVDILEDEF